MLICLAIFSAAMVSNRRFFGISSSCSGKVSEIVVFKSGL
jgi:hypothetical protein